MGSQILFVKLLTMRSLGESSPFKREKVFFKKKKKKEKIKREKMKEFFKNELKIIQRNKE